MNLNDLNKAQREAAVTLEGPLLIIAGAGSGKTRTMTYRIANLIEHGVSPSQILALTFTNKAAREMRERISALLGASAQVAWIGTFHSVCVRILRADIEKIGFSRSFVIYDDEDQLKIIRDLLRRYDVDEKALSPREMRALIGDAKTALLDADGWFAVSEKDRRAQTLHEIFTAYEQQLRQSNALDFDDLLIKTLELLSAHPPVLEAYQRRFQYIHVDEYQDTNMAQYSLVKLLSAAHHNLCVVGDDDQSIYGWRGADIRNILNFKQDFPEAKVIKLEQNYRSTQNILDAANEVIRNNSGRMDKALWTEGEKGDKIRLCKAGDEREEAAWICEHIRRMERVGLPFSDIAVLYRMHAQSRVLEEMLMRSGIPYRVYGGTRFYDRKEVKDAIAYLRLFINPKDDVALKRIINVPKRAIGDATVDFIADHARQQNLSMMEAMRDLPPSLSARPRNCANAFITLMDSLESKKSLGLFAFVNAVMEESGLISQYENSTDEEMQTKKENLKEFLGAVHEFEKNADDKSLEAYLENVALVTDMDMQQDAPDCVTLMTLHSAKGLEFKAVFIAGLEDGILPSMRSKDDPSRLEEERRLCYVGITRARKWLFFSMAARRTIFNQINMNRPSPFVKEISPALMSNEWEKTMTRHFGQPEAPVKPTAPKRNVSFGPPGMGLGAVERIPGITRGFSEKEKTAPPAVFFEGDKVLHRKFGVGQVTAVNGSGADARINVLFTAYGEKEFAVSIAPIVKLEG